MSTQSNRGVLNRSVVLSVLLALHLDAASITFHDADPITKRASPIENNMILSYNSSVKEATDSIVYIATSQTPSQKMQRMHPYYEQFFGSGRVPHQLEPRRGLGSGVIISADGYIVTNYHVIANADSITVKINNDPNIYEASIVGKDPKSDIAVIKIEVKKRLNPILMGRSDNLKIGDVVFAIGNPFGVGQSVTQGIISAQHKDSVGINEYENFIQTDASINPGNSGGALVDSRGALIGINSAIMTRSGGNNGIGFAIAVDMVRSIARELVENGTIQRGHLGVIIGDLTPEIQNLYTAAKGAIIIQIRQGSPAYKAGLQRGDLITKIDSKQVVNASGLKNIIGRYRPESTVEVTYERDKTLKTVKIKLGELEQTALSVDESSQLLSGIKLSNLDGKKRYDNRIDKDVEGVLITEVDPKSEAYRQKIRQGDVILQVEKELTPDVSTLEKVLKRYKNRYKRIYLNRSGRLYVTALK